jgi:phage terminase large subunit
MNTDPVHVDYTLTDRNDCLNIEINYNDNPFFPDVLRAEMEWDRSHDVDKYHHVWMGETVKHSEAQVFYGKWVIEEFESRQDVIFKFGADWGFSKDPSALIRAFVHEKDLYIDHEFYAVGVDIDHLPREFMTIPESDKYPITADSARPETISYMKRNGFPLMRGSEKGKGSIEDGIAFLRSFNKIIIHPRCKHTIDEFRLYSYVVDRLTGDITHKLIDKHNHLIDALRYAVEDLMKLHYSILKPSSTSLRRLGL